MSVRKPMSGKFAKVKDVVCGMMIDPRTAVAGRVYEGTMYNFCGQGCARAFDLDPQKYIQTR